MTAQIRSVPRPSFPNQHQNERTTRANLAVCCPGGLRLGPKLRCDTWINSIMRARVRQPFQFILPTGTNGGIQLEVLRPQITSLRSSWQCPAEGTHGNSQRSARDIFDRPTVSRRFCRNRRYCPDEFCTQSAHYAVRETSCCGRTGNALFYSLEASFWDNFPYHKQYLEVNVQKQPR